MYYFRVMLFLFSVEGCRFLVENTAFGVLHMLTDSQSLDS